MKIRNMALCALFAALLAVCAWLALPIGDISITLQTFGIFLTLGLLGGKRGSLAILVYLLLGMVGLPVFTGFQGGIGTLLGVTGGYIFGFLFSALLYWLITAVFGDRIVVRLLAMIGGLLVCYLLGSLWFRFGYLQGGNSIGMAAVLAKCVLPYLLPDCVKLALALIVSQRLRRHIH